jgi:hypothetical protein
MEKLEQGLFDKIKDNIPESLKPALLGEDIAEFIPHEDWEKAQSYLDEHQLGWRISYIRPLTPWEYLLIDEIAVVKSNCGFAIKFTPKRGNPSFIQVGSELYGKVREGDILDAHSIRLAGLYRSGETLYRIIGANDCGDPFFDIREQLKQEELWVETKRHIWMKYLRPLRDIQYRKEGWSDGRLIFLDMVPY